MVSGIAIVKSQVETGKVKLLAITNLKRAAAVPDLPTGAEAGYPALALDGLIGLFGPKNLPPGTAERIAADVQAVAADPSYRPAACRHRPAARPRRHRRVRGRGGRAAQEHCRHRQGAGHPADAIAFADEIALHAEFEIVPPRVSGLRSAPSLIGRGVG